MALWLTAVDDDVPAEGDDVRAAAAAVRAEGTISSCQSIARGKRVHH